MNTAVYYRQFLVREFESRRKKNGLYSMRAYARDLNLSSSRLSEILNGKKGISLKASKPIFDCIPMTSAEREICDLSISASHSKSPAQRKIALKQLKLFLLKHKSTTASETELTHVDSWVYLGILELLASPHVFKTAHVLAKKMDLPLQDVTDALKRLEQLQWIRMNEGSWQLVHEIIHTSNDIPVQAIQKIHASALKKASDSLSAQGVLEREFQLTTISFDAKKMTEAKTAIREFIVDFNERFYTCSDPNDEVYQLAIQFFRIGK